MANQATLRVKRLISYNLEQILQLNLLLERFARSHKVPDLGAFSMMDGAKD
mgnify:CR=1 FL=1